MPFSTFALRLRFLTLPVGCALMLSGGAAGVSSMAQTQEPPIAPAATAVPPAPGAKMNKPPFELPGSFRADVQTTQGTTVTKARFFATDGKIRLESKVRDASIILIALLKEKKATLLVPDKTIPDKGVFIVRELSPTNIQAMDLRSAWNDPKVTWESMPAATVEGVECDVYKLTRTTPAKPGDPAGAAPATTHEIYLNPATKLPIKVIVQTPASESTQLWSNVVVGPQDEALFKEPAGYVEKQN